MTNSQRLTGCFVFALATVGALTSIHVVDGMDAPFKRTAGNNPDGSTHTCADMNGGLFHWSWSNVPFSATCDASKNAAK